MEKVFFPDSSSLGFLFEFALKKAFLDSIYENNYTSSKGGNSQLLKYSSEKFKEKFVFLNEDLCNCFDKKDYHISQKIKSGCKKTLLDLKIKELFDYDFMFFYRFFFEEFYKEGRVFFETFYKKHLKNASSVEWFFDNSYYDGRFLEGFANISFIGNIIDFMKTENREKKRLIEKKVREINKIFFDMLSDRAKDFFLKMANFSVKGVPGEWSKSDFLIKLKTLPSKACPKNIEYVCIDFGEITFFLKELKSVFLTMRKIEGYDKNEVLKILRYKYFSLKKNFISSELKKTGVYDFIETELIDNRIKLDIFEYISFLARQHDKKINVDAKIKGVLLAGKSLRKIIQAGSYVYSLFSKGEKENKYLFLNRGEKKKIKGIHLYSFSSVSHKYYCFDFKNGEDILKGFSFAYKKMKEIEKREESYLNIVKKIITKSVYKNDLKTFRNGKEVSSLVLDTIYKGIKDILTNERGMYSYTLKMNVPPEKIFHLNMEIREKHYKIFRKIIEEKNRYIINCASPGMGKTTSVFKYCLENGMDFYYFSSRIKISEAILEDIKDGYEKFLEKYSPSERGKVKEKIKKTFENILYLTFNSTDTGREGKNGFKESVNIRCYLTNKNYEEKIKNIIENLRFEGQKFAFNFMNIDADLKKEISSIRNKKIGFDKTLRNKEATKILENEITVGEAIKAVYQHLIPALRKEFKDITIITSFTLQALEKTGNNRFKDIFYSIANNGNAFVMFDEIFGSSMPMILINRIFNEDLMGKVWETSSVFFLIADANITHQEMVNYIIKLVTGKGKKKSGKLKVNKIVLHRVGEGEEDIAVRKTKVGDKEIPVILTKSFPANSINFVFKGIFIDSRKYYDEEYLRIEREIKEKILEKLKKIGEKDAVFVYIQDKNKIHTIKNLLLSHDKEDFILTEDNITVIDSDVHKKASKEKVILATSSASRGLTFPNVKDYIIVFQSFNVTSGLNELSQVIYRGRGRGNDDTDKNFDILYIYPVYPLSSEKDIKFVSSYKLLIFFTEIFLTLSIFSLFSGFKIKKGDEEKMKYIMIPIPPDEGTKAYMQGHEIFRLDEMMEKVEKNFKYLSDRKIKREIIESLLTIWNEFFNKDTIMRVKGKFSKILLNYIGEMSIFFGNDGSKLNEIENEKNIKKSTSIIKSEVEKIEKTVSLFLKKNEKEIFNRNFLKELQKTVSSVKDHYPNFLFKIANGYSFVLVFDNSFLNIPFFKDTDVFSNKITEIIEYVRKAGNNAGENRHIYSFDLNELEELEEKYSLYNYKSDNGVVKEISRLAKVTKKIYKTIYSADSDNVITDLKIKKGKSFFGETMVLNPTFVDFSKTFNMYSIVYLF